MFDLDSIITEWRRQMTDAGITSPEALDELESHLRDEIERQLGTGADQARAFEVAVREIGRPTALAQEFKKTGWRIGGVLWRLKSILARPWGPPEPSLVDFAPGAREILELAPQESRRFGHDFVGTEHVLLGLIQRPSGTVAGVMRRFGVTGEIVRAEIEKVVGPGASHQAAAGIPFTPRAKRALQLASQQARELRQPVAAPEHIFLGLLLEGGGIASLVLKNLGFDAVAARAEIAKTTGPASD